MNFTKVISLIQYHETGLIIFLTQLYINNLHNYLLEYYWETIEIHQIFGTKQWRINLHGALR
jgi:hypothetical protein